ncbi:chemerin-like receptor 1 [Leptodactylus fuscus]|uniref:chemerin-like receptor 1 n=1 Tax=Leptodactylus fuscus TaxID=238119 RepID=UPI003F4E8C44
MDPPDLPLDFYENTTSLDNVTFTPYNFAEDTDDRFISTFFYVIQVMTIIFDTIGFVIGIFRNGLVIWIIVFKVKKTVNLLWCLNLAAADFVFEMTYPLEITELIMDGHWPFGGVICKVMSTILFLSTSASTTFLMVISVDQCTLVMCPKWSKRLRTLKVASTISAITWSSCFILCSPHLVFSDVVHDSDDDMTYCDNVETSWNRTAEILRFVSLSLIPFSISLICNSLVKLRLRRSKSTSRSHRSIKVIVTFLFSALYFWLPFQIWSFLEILTDEMDEKVDHVVSQLVYCIIFLNCCVNPVVHIFVRRDFKKSFVKSFSVSSWRTRSWRSILRYQISLRSDGD